MWECKGSLGSTARRCSSCGPILGAAAAGLPQREGVSCCPPPHPHGGGPAASGSSPSQWPTLRPYNGPRPTPPYFCKGWRAIATAVLLPRYAEVVRPGGHITSITGPQPGTGADGLDLGSLFPKNIAFSTEMVFSKAMTQVDIESQHQTLERVSQLLEAGTMKSTVRATKPYTAGALQESMEVLAGGKSVGKLVHTREIPTQPSKCDDAEAVNAAVSRYFSALGSQDVDTIVDSYAPDGQFFGHFLGTAKGSDALRATYTQIFKDIALNVELTIESTDVAGDQAVVVTSSVGTVHVNAANIDVPEANREMFHMARVEGRWRIQTYMFNKAAGPTDGA